MIQPEIEELKNDAVVEGDRVSIQFKDGMTYSGILRDGMPEQAMTVDGRADWFDYLKAGRKVRVWQSRTGVVHQIEILVDVDEGLLTHRDEPFSGWTTVYDAVNGRFLAKHKQEDREDRKKWAERRDEITADWPPMNVVEGKEEEWAHWEEINTDISYNAAVVEQVRRASAHLDEGHHPKVAFDMAHDEFDYGLSYFQAASAAHALAYYHPRGEAVKRWWKEENG